MPRFQKNWTKEEIEYLEKNYQVKTDKEIAIHLGRTRDAIERKRSKLGLNKNKKLNLSDHDIEDILLSKLTYQEIAQKYGISREQARSIFRKRKSKAYVASVKLWTQEEENYLKENYKTMGDFTIATQLKRTPASILKKRVQLGLLRKEFHIVEQIPDRYWSDEEVEFLVGNIDFLTYHDIADHLGRSLHAVMVKASKMGLITNGSKWSFKEDSILLEFSNHSIEELAFLLERSQKAIKHRLNKLKIRRNKHHNTSLERKIESILEDLKVDYKKQIILGSEFNFKADFVIGKIVIEAHGDYWHGNPLFYPIPNRMQKLAIEKDKIKRNYFQELGYLVYEIWEQEVNSDFPKIKQKLARLLGNQ